MFEVSGDENIKAALKDLPRSVRNKAIRPALRDAAKIVQARAVQNVVSVVAGSPETTGLLARSVVIRSIKDQNRDLRVAVAIGRAVSRKGVRVGLYGSVLEFGKNNQPPRPWLRPAIRESESAVIAKVLTGARKRLDAAVEDAKR